MRTIAIVGGGLGGLATAVALRTYGFEVRIFERASFLGEVGAGINVSPQATKVLEAIGLSDKLSKIGNKLASQIRRSFHTGKIVAEMDMQHLSAKLGAQYYVFHRADLLNVLSDALDPNHIFLGHKCVDVRENEHSVSIMFENGHEYEADIVIGADGIHSAVRRHLYGEDKPKFTGQIAWRALLSGDSVPPEVLGPHGFCGWVGDGCHLMTYYVRGRDLINIVTQADTADWVEEGWSIPGNPDEMRSSFSGAAPDLGTLLNAVTECSRWGLFSRAPTSDWGRGRIQLIGDAAHAMLPNAGQGAAQAFEDAYILARWLDAKRDDPENALENFRRVRIPRTHAIQRQSALNAKVLHSGKWDNSQENGDPNTNRAQAALGMEWILGYDVIADWDRVREYPLSRA